MEAADSAAENAATTETTEATTDAGTPATEAAETATDAAETADNAETAETTTNDDATPSEPVPAALTGHALVDTLDKDGLELFARAEFGRELDKRKRLDALRREVHALLDGTPQKREAAQEAEIQIIEQRSTSEPVRARHRTLKNPDTGEFWEFEWNPLFAKNADLEPIYEG